MRPKTLILVCNAHLDPVWLWQWEEGLAETLSTFRTAAHFCDEFEGFIFCHNEALLYEWVETHDSELFAKIQGLVDRGRWYVMGGWYLQPDCNLPSGESLVRQILVGKRYIKEKFKIEPYTAINLDSFGHSRGLVQILKKSGYSSYLFCRPDGKHLELPGDDFTWVGYDGSKILAHRAPDHYNSYRGQAGTKIERWLDENKEKQAGILLWGIGNHGGGPSKEDLQDIERLIVVSYDDSLSLKENEMNQKFTKELPARRRQEKKRWQIRHGRPEDYFNLLEKQEKPPPQFCGDLNPWAVGCYTSMALLKQKHRLLENTYFLTEKMVTHAALQGLIDYPKEKLKEALKDLLFCEFHDILPGSSIAEVEEYALQRMDHGLEILSRLRANAFFALAAGHEPAQEGEFPLFVYNPHPYDVEETVVCEFQPAEPNFKGDIFRMPELKDSNGNPIKLQLEKESCNILVDQRKRIVFEGKLKAASMTRFSCGLKEVKAKPEKVKKEAGLLRFESDKCQVEIDKKTGLMNVYRVNGTDFLKSLSCQAMVMKDDPDPWGMKVRAFRDLEGVFILMSETESARFAGVSLPRLDPVRIIEEGPMRTIVEALFKYKNSTLCLRYKIPKKGSEIEIEVRVYWQEKDRMLKLSLPTPFRDGKCRGQAAYGVEEFIRRGEELAAQKWLSISSHDGENALTVINNCIHGFDFADGELRLSLLRSAAYAGHPVADGIPIVRQDRFEQRIDQGERFFTLWINAGSAEERLLHIDREALVRNEPPMVLCYCPSGRGPKSGSGIILSDDVVQLTAAKMAEDKPWLIFRLFEPTGSERRTQVTIPYLDLEFPVSLQPFEIKSVAVEIESKKLFNVDLLERSINS